MSEPQTPAGRQPVTAAGRRWLEKRSRHELWHAVGSRHELWHAVDGRRTETLAAIVAIEADAHYMGWMDREARALPAPAVPSGERPWVTRSAFPGDLTVYELPTIPDLIAALDRLSDPRPTDPEALMHWLRDRSGIRDALLRGAAAPAVPSSAGDDLPWQPDLDSMGIDFSLHDRRALPDPLPPAPPALVEALATALLRWLPGDPAGVVAEQFMDDPTAFRRTYREIAADHALVREALSPGGPDPAGSVE